MGGLFDIMQDVDYCLIGSIGQVVTDAGWTDIWVQATMNKNQAWLKGGDGDPSNVIYEKIQGLKGDNNQSDWNDFLAKYATDPTHQNEWSSALVVALQQTLAGVYSGSDWGAILGTVGSLANVVSALMSQDTTTGDAEGKNMQSQLQTDNSALQPLSDFGSAYAQMLSALVNVLSQVGPGA